jgi:hypothetical protein
MRRLFVLEVVALAIVVVSVLGTQRSTTAQDGLSWLSLGILAVALAGLVSAYWLASASRSLAATRRTIHRRVLTVIGATDAQAQTETNLAAAGMRWYHRPGCPLVLGRVARAEAPAVHVRAGREPCRVCQP